MPVTMTEIISKQQQPDRIKSRRHLQIVVLLAIVVVAYLLVVSKLWLFPFDAFTTKRADDVCSSVCRQRRTERFESASISTPTLTSISTSASTLAATGTVTGTSTETATATATATATSLLDNEELVQRVSAAKERLHGKLRIDYGEYFEPIFLEHHNDRPSLYRPVTDDGPSLERLKRKLMVKVLSMQSAVTVQRNADSDSASRGADFDFDFHGCDCSGGGDTALRDDATESLDPEDTSVVFEGNDGKYNYNHENDNFFAKYVWATGGNSIAAGHGNLYNESYTAHMERDLKDVFGSIGIEFEARNYALSNAPSATAVSMCWKEIFGHDIDFFSYDYGLTDGGNVVNMMHYVYRGARSASRPALMMMESGANHEAKRLAVLKPLEEMGLAAFFGETETLKAIRHRVPDSAGLSQDEIDALPEYVRNYICSGQIERGDPFCFNEKYTKWGCTPRTGQVMWHPGFKSNALLGHALALFLMETLLETLRDFSDLKPEAIPQLLSQLEKEDIDLHNNFTTGGLPDEFTNLFSFKDLEGNDTESNIDPSVFFKGPSMCHTARLPSQTRYLGILTDTDKMGQPAPRGTETYYRGHDMNDAKHTSSANQEMRLVRQTPNDRGTNCTAVIFAPDYYDYFYANSKDNWTKLVFPNDAEKRVYGYDPEQFQGIIVLHFDALTCTEKGICKEGALKPEDFAKNLWEMKVNNELVTNLIMSGGKAVIARGDNGVRFAPDSNGRYTIEIKVNGDEENFLAITDFVLY